MPDETSIRLMHISDLHFGLANQDEVWDSLAKHVKEARPHLLLVTGDIIDSPMQDEFRRARKCLDGLGVRYWVCAGNHDRHPRGNAGVGILVHPKSWASLTKSANAWFDNIFENRVISGDEVKHIFLEEKGNKWKLAIVGLDTSKEVKFLAQGFVSIEQLGKLDTAAAAIERDVDLSILLQHHHLLSIPQLESERQKATGVLRATTLLNAGTLLENLAKNNIPLVLHGHEHMHFAGKYASLNGRRNPVTVVAAGSATGVVKSKRCEHNAASFNVIELTAQRTVLLHNFRWNSSNNRFEQNSEIVLFSAADIRRMKLLRQHAIDEMPTSQIVKTFNFTPERDVTVREIRTEWAMDAGKLAHDAFNSTSEPHCDRIEIDWGDGQTALLDTQYEPTNEDHAYTFEVPINSQGRRFAAKLTIDTSWSAGAILTKGDLKLLEGKGGRLRNEGYEFASLVVPQPLESITLLVTLPEAFQPDEMLPFAEHADSAQAGPVRSAARDGLRVQVLGPGQFLLYVNFPTPKMRYGLKWRVPDVPHSTVDNLALTGGNGESLLEAFRGALPTRLQVPSGVALYGASTREGQSWRRIAMLRADPRSKSEPPHSKLSLTTVDSVYTKCWWDNVAIISEGDEGSQSILLEGERCCILAPIVRVQGAEDEESFGPTFMVRLGYNHRLEVEKGVEDLLTALDNCGISLLNRLISLREVQ